MKNAIEHIAGRIKENQLDDPRWHKGGVGARERADIQEYGRVVNEALYKMNQAHDAVHSLDDMVKNSHLPKKFVGLFHNKVVDELRKMNDIRITLGTIEADIHKFVD